MADIIQLYLEIFEHEKNKLYFLVFQYFRLTESIACSRSVEPTLARLFYGSHDLTSLRAFTPLMNKSVRQLRQIIPHTSS